MAPGRGTVFVGAGMQSTKGTKSCLDSGLSQWLFHESSFISVGHICHSKASETELVELKVVEPQEGKVVLEISIGKRLPRCRSIPTILHTQPALNMVAAPVRGRVTEHILCLHFSRRGLKTQVKHTFS